MAANLGFDVAAGMYESTLNTVLAQVYHAIYPNLLKATIPINELNISSIDIDIQAPPTVKLSPSKEAKAQIAATLKALYNTHQAKVLSDKKVVATAIDDESAFHEIASSATFSASVSKLALTVNYEDGSSPTKVPSATLSVHATISVDGSDSDLTVKILSATIDIPNDPSLTDLLNKAAIPYLITYLNTKILRPIKIPSLEYESLKFSAPLPVVQQSYFTAFSALGSTPATIPSPLPWPKDGVYIAVDTPTMEAAARLIFPLGPQENFSWGIFSGHVGATVNPPSVNSINSDGSLSATIEANASCQLTMETPWPLPNITFGPSATARAAWTFRPLIKGGELQIVPEGIPFFSFSFDWGIPSWINWLFEPLEYGLAAALNAALGPLIANVLHIPGIPICKIPDIPIDFGEGLKITIAIDSATPSGFQDSMLLITAQANVSKQ